MSPQVGQVADNAPDVEYWLSRASGRTSDDDPGWYFTGRAELTGTLAAFLDDGDGTLVVTGAAGTGKSAIIARAVTLSDPVFRADPRYRKAVARVPFGTVPPEGSVDVAVLARNKDTAELYEQLLVLLGRPFAASGLERLTILRERLLEVLAGQPKPLTVVLDGLDEARNPFETAGALVGPLIRAERVVGGPAVRMVIGVRSPGPARPDTVDEAGSVAGLGPASPPEAEDEKRTRNLLDLVLHLVQDRPHQMVRTDGPDARADIVDYTETLLAAESSPYRNSPDARRRLSEVVAAHVAPSFLDARLAGRRLRETADLQDPADPAWLATLGGGTISLLGEDIASVATPAFPERHILAVLRAAAFAQGAGIPWAEIWPAVVEAILDERPPDADALIRHVVTGRLGGYLVQDTEDERVVHRPAHERLAEVLRTQPQRVLPHQDPRDRPTSDDRSRT
ncbi:ATP-binding protein [Thermopolyspora sp. NPDC052614]|uniref:ATP-binding protein n=1 Tax=Thermopolyspora sp. NPDC052614 TaxID=3155682 RepID=UPI0034130CB8